LGELPQPKFGKNSFLKDHVAALMSCWICGAEADSGEHMIKATDLRALFGHVDQRSPLFMHTDLRRNLPVPGIKSNLLKHKARLCSRCNNELTQKHDRAWTALSQYLQARTPPIRPGMKVRLCDIFPGKVSRSMLDVHLYFVKLFGCIATEHAIPLPIGEFSSAIRSGQAHPHVWISIGTSFHRPEINHAGCTEVQAAKLNGKVVFAIWTYFLGHVDVNIMYSLPGQRRRGLVDAWNPATAHKALTIAKTRY
jgi:hypothetical protein